MEAMELLRTRYSASKLGAPPPSEEAVEAMLEAAAHAPDHGRLQPWRLILIEGDARRALGEILLKPSPDAIPRRKLLFSHTVRGRVASVARLPWSRHSTTQRDQRQIRLPFQVFTRLHVVTQLRGQVVQTGSLRVEFLQPPRLFFMRRVHEHQPSDFARKLCYEAPRI